MNLPAICLTLIQLNFTLVISKAKVKPTGKEES